MTNIFQRGSNHQPAIAAHSEDERVSRMIELQTSMLISHASIVFWVDIVGTLRVKTNHRVIWDDPLHAASTAEAPSTAEIAQGAQRDGATEGAQLSTCRNDSLEADSESQLSDRYPLFSYGLKMS